MAFFSPFQVSQEIVSAAFDAVPNTNPWPINRSGVVPGEIAWDECECGQLAIQEVRRFPSINFPEEISRPQDGCGEGWLVHQYLLGLARCSPGPDDNGNPPPMSSLQTIAERMSLDMSLVRSAVYCRLQTLYNMSPPQIYAFSLLDENVVGPSGLCVGFTLSILIGFPNDCGC